MKDKETTHKHPSYVMVGFSRRQGDPGHLFGSNLERHFSYITLCVSAGKMIRDHELGTEYYMGSMTGDIIEIDFSAAQFAELLTTSNVGSGVPATMRRFQNERVPPPPKLPTEHTHIRDTFEEKISKAKEDIVKVKNSVAEILEKKSLTKGDKDAINQQIAALSRLITDSAPHLLNVFEEAVDKTVMAAKTEVDSFYTSAVMKAGLQALQEQQQVLQLAENNKESEDPNV